MTMTWRNLVDAVDAVASLAWCLVQWIVLIPVVCAAMAWSWLFGGRK